MSARQIHYSDRYSDGQSENRHVVLPRETAKYVPESHLMPEGEWRRLGVQQPKGWTHYTMHEPGPRTKQFKVSLPWNWKKLSS